MLEKNVVWCNLFLDFETSNNIKENAFKADERL